MPPNVSLTNSEPPWLTRTYKKKQTVVARRGSRLSFKAEPLDAATGQWKFDQQDDLPPHTLSADRGTLTVVVGYGGTGYGTYTASDASGASDPWTVTASRLSQLGRGARNLAVAIVAIVVYVVSVLILAGTFEEHSAGAWIFGALTLALAVIVLQCVLRSVPTDPPSGFSQLFVGADRRASTSKTQYMLWTLLVVFALSCVAGAVLLLHGSFICDMDPAKEGIQLTGTQRTGTFCVVASAWDQYLILLGVPAGAAVLAKGITSYKVVNGIVQKSESKETSPMQVATNDQGSADLVDVQYLLFNIITLVFVISVFVRTSVLGEVPAILLGLTSTAAATYVLNKSLQTTRPTITAVTPSTISTHARVEIRGKYLFPPDSGEPPVVKLGGIRAKVLDWDRNSNKIVVAAPPGMPAGSQKATVITAADVETEGYDIQVSAFVIQGVGDLATSPVTIYLVGAPVGWSTAYVNFGPKVSPGTKVGTDRVTADVPAGLPPDYDLVVTLDGQRTPAYRIES